MAVRCERCGRTFQNKYAVWGHLRACRSHSVKAEPAEPASLAYGLAGAGLEPQLSQEFADQERELRRRRLALEQRELERQENAARQREMNELMRQIEREAEKETRRGVVEEVCSPFVDLRHTLKGYELPPGLSDAAKRRVEEELKRAGSGRSRHELLKLAEQARDQVYAQVLQAQDDRRAEAMREAAERKALLAREREEAQGQERTTPSPVLPVPDNRLPVVDRLVKQHGLTDGNDANEELEDDAEDEVDSEDEPEEDEWDDDDPDTESDAEPEERPAPTGSLGALLTLGAVAAGVALVVKALTPSRVWISDPRNGGDGSFAVGSAPPGSQPPWKVASELDIQQGLDSGALRRV